MDAEKPAEPAPVTTTVDDFKEVPYNDNEFNKLFKEMIDDNEELNPKPEGLMNRFSAKKPIIIKPTDQTARMILFNLLRRIIHIASKKDEAGNMKESPEIKKSMTTAFFLSLINLKKKTQGQPDIETFKNQIKNENISPISKFITKLGGIGMNAARFLPIISTLQEYYIGKHTLSFDEKSITEDVIKKQIEDAQKGIDNQFSLMSAFIGTKSQKVAARTAVIAGAATGLWALVAKLQQNPQTAGILMGVVAAAGPQAAFAGAIFAAVAVGYYAFLKVQDKYAKYFMLIRTMNEFIIVLNKVDRLVRLSYFISDKYSFDVNLKEIEAQLKVIFKRFDGMLNDDDRSKIEKDLETNLTPSVADAASEVVLVKAGELDNPSSQPEEQNGQGQGGGGFLSRMGFDEEKWNKMLNDDVVKLNIYFTTSMTEFNMILNVIQMTQLTDDGKPAPAATAAPAAPATGIDKIKATTREIKSSTEYHKMVIGILLNDILKLRIDYSFCSRGGGLGGMTKTNDELVCLENTGSDPAGNKMSLFRKNLHEQMKHLVSVLNNPNTPYPPEIKSEILKEVVEPYKIMVINSQRTDHDKEDVIKRFFLTPNCPFLLNDNNDNNLAQFIQKEFPSTSLNPTTKGGSSNRANQIGGGFFDRFRNTKPSRERDGQIIPFLKKYPYELVSDQSLTEFLARVNKFVKSVGTPTAEEQKKAQEVAKEIAHDTANVLVNDAAKVLPEATQEATQKATQEAVQNLAKTTTTTPGATPGGRRRFTRRRNRKNYSNTRGRKQSRRTM